MNRAFRPREIVAVQFLTCKAAEAGRKLGLVNRSYTTQDCYRCGHREKKQLSEREHCGSLWHCCTIPFETDTGPDTDTGP
ncbi:MAG TPA: hypothetical protein DHV41_04775, partial [Parachlamydiales bacterium]|nr:hypothetical protein [Parachlamydiales bacterium]